MKRALDYLIISASNLDRLQRAVQDFLAERPEAWLPSGGPFFHDTASATARAAGEADGGTWHQAVYEVPTPDDSPTA